MTQGGPAQAECRIAGRYRLIEQAGTGGMAVVWRAFDEVLNRRVAVKLLTAAAARDDELVARLHTEAQAAAQLSHPHIIAVHDFGQDRLDNGTVRPYVVMELVEGATLQQATANGQVMPWPKAVTIVGQIASALSAAHQHGIVHRDVTTTNVMLTAGGVKVVDFGIAALLGEHDPGTGGLLGTPAYVAPERLGPAPAPATPAIDIYALGIVFYFLLAGQPPWTAPTPTGQLEAHLRFDPSPLPQIPGLPTEIASLCMQCLAKDPDDRPSAAMIASLLAQLPSITTEALPARPRHTQPQVTSLLAWLSDTTAEREIEEAAPAEPAAVKEKRRHLLARRSAVAAVTAAAALAGAVVFLDGPDSAHKAESTAMVPAQVTETPPPAPPASPSVTPVTPGATGAGVPGSPDTPGGSTTPPTISPIPTATASPPAPGTSITSDGGTITVECNGATATITHHTPAAGFSVERLQSGPAKDVRVIFAAPAHESEIKVTCAGGTPKPEVKEKPL